MVVEATYVLCTSHVHNILEKEARHADKVKLSYLSSIRMTPVFSAITLQHRTNLRSFP